MVELSLSGVISWFSVEAFNTPEPIVLLVLGGLFLTLGFRLSARRERVVEPSSVAEAPPALSRANPRVPVPQSH